MNLIDKTIELFSPQYGLKRAVARQKMNIVKRGFEGAARSPRFDWKASEGSVNNEIAASIKILRARSHDLARNNELITKAINTHVDNIVGTGIVPKVSTGNDERDKLIEEAFARWSERADPSGQLDFYGQQAQAVQTMIESGEVFARKRVVRFVDELTVPFQVQLFEPEYIDEQKNETKGKSKKIVNGIEFDNRNNRLAYWMFANHPSEQGLGGGSSASKRVPASDVAHLYEPQRIQHRGVPWVTPVITNARDLADYMNSEIYRKKLEACNVGVLRLNDDNAMIGPQQEGGKEPILGAGIYDHNGSPVERMEPGSYVIARGGADLKFNNPMISAAFDPVVMRYIRGIAAGIRCPYELMSTDYMNVNYSSSRSAMLGYRRFVRRMQRLIVVPQFCVPVWRWFLEYARLIGLVREEEIISVSWVYPNFEHINPIDDVEADIKSVRAGFKSRPQVILENGGDPTKVHEETVEDHKRLDKDKVILDSDPRYVSQQGQKHKH